MWILILILPSNELILILVCLRSILSSKNIDLTINLIITKIVTSILICWLWIPTSKILALISIFRLILIEKCLLLVLSIIIRISRNTYISNDNNIKKMYIDLNIKDTVISILILLRLVFVTNILILIRIFIFILMPTRAIVFVEFVDFVNFVNLCSIRLDQQILVIVLILMLILIITLVLNARAVEQYHQYWYWY